MIEIILVCFTLLTLIATYIHYRRQNYLPGPWHLPIIGCLHRIDPKTPNLTFFKLAEKYGPIYRLKLGSINTVFISDGKLLKKVLMKDATLARPPLYVFDIIFEGKGLIYSPLDVWKDQRKFVTNFLKAVGATKASPNKKNLENQMRQSAEEFIQYVQNQGKSVTLNPVEAVTKYVSNITSSLFLGRRDGELSKTLINSFDKIVKQNQMVGTVNFFPFLRFIPTLRKAVQSIKDAMNEIHTILNQIVCENLETPFNVMSLAGAFMVERSKCRSDQVYNIDQLQHLLYDIFGAATETSVTSIMWVLLYLAHFKQVQNKVRKELWDVLQERDPRVDDLARLPYTEATLAEVARIRTVVPVGVPHHTSEDVRVENVTIPKNTVIMSLPWAIHMDPKVWKDPEEFCPGRFLNDEGKFCQSESFVPFQAGKRMCVGKDLANMMTFLFVSTVLQKFKLEGCNSGSVDLSYVFGFTTTPKPQDLLFIEL